MYLFTQNRVQNYLVAARPYAGVTAPVENGRLWQTITDSIGQVLDNSGHVIEDRINL